MPTDHPDGTRAIVLSRADIQTPIDVQHQTINVKTNFKEQEVGVADQSEWAALQDIDKRFHTLGINEPFNGFVSEAYNVPAGKTLYINHFAVVGHASVAANADLQQHTMGTIVDVTALQTKAYVGGNGGDSVDFATPLVFPGGTAVSFKVISRANHNLHLYLVANGYEV